MTDASGTIQRSYDKLNRVTQVTDCNGKTIKYSYDELGNRICLTYPGGETVRYTWDDCQQLTKMTDSAGGITTYGYDDAGRLIQTERPDGSAEGRTYDKAGRLTQIKDTAADGEVLQNLTYTYDSRGNITKIEGTDQTAAKTTASSMTCTYGADNRLVTWNGKDVIYDDNGNMLTGPSGSKWARFTYDIYGRLIKVVTTDGDETVYAYDAEGVRTKTSHTDTEGNTTQETYVTDRETSYTQLLSSTCDGKTTTYSYGLGLSGATANGETLYYHYNHLGSATLLTDAKGDAKVRAAYGTYGELLGVVDTGSGKQLTEGTGALGFLYNAQFGIRTDANGLYYMRARYYSPDSKRFITMDPLKGELTATQSLNRYSYVQGNPVSAIDPLGLSPLRNLALLIPDKETVLNIARVLPWTSNIMGVYDMYTAAKERDGKKFLTALSFTILGSYGGALKGVKYARKIGKISAQVERGVRIGVGAMATSAQAYLFTEALDDAKAEMAAGSGKLSDISGTTWMNMLTTGFNTGFIAGATIADIPRFTPKKLKNNSLGKGKAGTTAAKELAGEMPAVSGKVAGGYKTNYAQSRGNTFNSSYNIPTDSNGYTKSNFKLGQDVHKEYKQNEVDDLVKFKEYRLPSKKRIDFIDFENKTIYELKPYNPNQIKKGNKQLEGYLREVESLFGAGWTTVLDTY